MSNVKWHLDLVQVDGTVLLVVFEPENGWVERREVTRPSHASIVIALDDVMAQRRARPDVIVTDHSSIWTDVGRQWIIKHRPFTPGEQIKIERIARWLRDKPSIGFEDMEAAKVRMRKHRLSQTDLAAVRKAIASEKNGAVPWPLPQPAPVESPMTGCSLPIQPLPTPAPEKPIRIGPYMWLRSETGGVLYRRSSFGGYDRVRLVRYRAAPGYRFPASKWHFERVRFQLLCMIARLMRLLRAPAGRGTTPQPEMRPSRTDPNPSTRLSVSNRFRFSAGDAARATMMGEGEEA